MKFGTHTTQHIHRTQETTADWHSGRPAPAADTCVGIT